MLSARLRRRRPAWFVMEAMLWMALALTLFGVATRQVVGWWQITRQTQTVEQSHIVLRAALAPAAWDDCTDTQITPSPASCRSAEAEFAAHSAISIETRDFYRLNPPDPGCGAFDTSAFAVRDATVTYSRSGFADLVQQGVESRGMQQSLWAWTAVPVAPTTPAESFAADLRVNVAEPTGFDATTGQPRYGNGRPADFPPDGIGPNACYVIVVPVGHRIAYNNPANPGLRPRPRCALPLNGGNAPC